MKKLLLMLLCLSAASLFGMETDTGKDLSAVDPTAFIGQRVLITMKTEGIFNGQQYTGELEDTATAAFVLLLKAGQGGLILPTQSILDIVAAASENIVPTTSE